MTIGTGCPEHYDERASDIMCGLSELAISIVLQEEYTTIVCGIDCSTDSPESSSTRPRHS